MIDESEGRNGDVRSARLVEVRADQLRLGDVLDEGVRVVALTAEADDESPVYVTTTSRRTSRIAWPKDHLVKVIRGPHWRPGLGFNGPES